MKILHTYLHMKMEHTECSETSAYKIQKSGNYPEERIQYSERGLKFEFKNTTLSSLQLGFLIVMPNKIQFHINYVTLWSIILNT